MKKDPFINRYVKTVKESLCEFWQDNPPTGLLYYKLKPIFDKLYEDGYNDGLHDSSEENRE